MLVLKPHKLVSAELTKLVFKLLSVFCISAAPAFEIKTFYNTELKALLKPSPSM